MRTISLLALLTTLSCAEFLPSALQYTSIKSSDANDPLIVQTEYGPVKGYYNQKLYRGTSLDLFKANAPRAFAAIPFADPPTGNNRFKDPQPYSTLWKGKTRYAKVDAPACPQKIPGIQSEDCLYLHVYTPPIERVRKNPNMPVLFFIYGGSFAFGSTKHLALHDGRKMTDLHDVIVVVANYRLGVFGYLAAETNNGDLSGNFGIKDQIAALKWVHRNIRNFGGDPKRISVMGESAGASSTLIHLVSPATNGLIHSAGVLSAPMVYRPRTVAQAHSFGLEWAKNVSCTTTIAAKTTVDLDCIRKMPYKAIVKSQVEPMQRADVPANDMGFWWPHQDGQILPGDLFKLLEEGKAKKVPILIGWTRDEGGVATFDAHTPLIRFFKKGHEMFQADKASAFIKTLLPQSSDVILKQFPLKQDDVEWNEVQIVRIATDYIFRCSSYYIAKKLAAQGLPTYMYEFQQIQRLLPLGRCNKDMVCHGFEMGYFFQPGWFKMSAGEEAFAGKFMKYVVGFVQGNVNAQATPTWPLYNKSKQVMLLKEEFKVRDEQAMEQMCGFWNDKVGYRR